MENNNLNIKTHNNNNGIKSTKNIKQGADKIKDESEKNISNNNDKSHSPAVHTTDSTGGIITNSGASGYIIGKKVTLTTANAKQLQKDYMQSKKEYNQLKKEIRHENIKSYKNIANAKREYNKINKDNNHTQIKNTDHFKSNETNTFNSTPSGKIKDAKYEYEKIKMTEQESIRRNRKKLRTNWRKLLREFGYIKKANTNALLIGAFLGIIVLLVSAALLLSPLGVMFAGNSTEGKYTLESAMQTIDEEFSKKIKDIEKANTFDKEVLLNYGCGYKIAVWSDIVAIWDTKLTLGSNDDIFVIDEDKFQKLRTIAWDMISISSKIEQKAPTTKPSTIPATTDKKELTTEKNERTLIIEVNYTEVDNIMNKYSFTSDQNEFVMFLLSSSEYISLFNNPDFDSYVDIDNFDFGNETANELQKKIVSVAHNASKYGINAQDGYCQRWVADIYKVVTKSRGHAASARAAGEAWGVSRDLTKIQIGATVYGYAKDTVNGHVGIYIGNGKVIHNIGYVKIESLSEWAKKYHFQSWGWENGKNLSGNPEYNSKGIPYVF